MADPTGGGVSSFVGSFKGDGGGWGLEGFGGAGATGVTDFQGDYVGGGHALCRSRSRWVFCCVVVFVIFCGVFVSVLWWWAE